MNSRNHFPSIKASMTGNSQKIDESFKNDDSNLGILDENELIRSEFEYLPHIIDESGAMGNQIRIGTREQNSSSTSKTYEEIEKKGENNNVVYIKKTRKIEITDIVEKKIPERAPTFEKIDHSRKKSDFNKIETPGNFTIKHTSEKPDINEIINRKRSIWNRFDLLKFDFVKKSIHRIDEFLKPKEGQRTKFTRLERIREAKLSYPFLIIPVRSTFRLYWDLLITVIITLNSFFVPIVLAFPEILDAFDPEYYILAFFWIDIGLNFRTTFFNKDFDEIIHPTLIAVKYVSSFNFLLDLVSAIPISNLIEKTNVSPNIKLLNIMKASRLLRLNRVLRYLRDDSLKILYKIFRYFFAFILMIHWITCVWFAFVSSDYIPGYSTDLDSWVPSNIRVNSGVSQSNDPRQLVSFFYDDCSNFEKYIFTLYSMIMIILGSDIGPTSPNQALFAVIICVIGSITIAVLFGNISLLMMKLNSKNTFYQNKLEELEFKLKQKCIPNHLKNRVFEYFEFCWRKRKVFEQLSDFSELSAPLQKECLIYMHKDLVTNVPLFCELEANEILSIIQKLKTQIYMPGDKIIREGERGNEMFFLTEGLVEVVVKKHDEAPLSLYLKKGLLNGNKGLEKVLIKEIRKTTSDVNSIDFCILEIFTKIDYENLKYEFPDIGPRLKAGLKQYKSKNRDNLMDLAKKSELFSNFSDEDLKDIILNYIEDIFVDPHRIILKPKTKINAMYFILLGTVNVYDNTPESLNLIQKVLLDEDKFSKTRGNSEQNMNSDQFNDNSNETYENELECLDDTILLDMRDNLLYDKDKNIILKDIQTMCYGESFGALNFGTNNVSSKYFYISESACQLGVITTKLLGLMKLEKPSIYDKLKSNFLQRRLTSGYSMVVNDRRLTELERLPEEDEEYSASVSDRESDAPLINEEKQKESDPISNNGEETVDLLEYNERLQILEDIILGQAKIIESLDKKLTELLDKDKKEHKQKNFKEESQDGAENSIRYVEDMMIFENNMNTQE